MRWKKHTNSHSHKRLWSRPIIDNNEYTRPKQDNLILL